MNNLVTFLWTNNATDRSDLVAVVRLDSQNYSLKFSGEAKYCEGFNKSKCVHVSL